LNSGNTFVSNNKYDTSIGRSLEAETFLCSLEAISEKSESSNGTKTAENEEKNELKEQSKEFRSARIKKKF
jgi:hypothetical protein